MPNISDINGVAIASLGDFNGVAKASITDINGVTIVVSGTNLLLDTYTGAAAAYSVRKLDKDYTGNCMRVRRDSDDSETDIGFDGSGDLSTSAIATHCGSANGYVVTWYDQSGNTNNATQSTDGNQPQIYNGSAVITENGKPALLSGHFENISGISKSSDWSSFEVYNSNGDTSFVTYAGDNSPNSHSLLAYSGLSNSQYVRNFGTPDFYVDGSSVTFSNMGDAYTAVGTSTQLLLSIVDANNATWDAFYLSAYNGASFTFSGYMQEQVFFGSDQTSNRSGIEGNINAYFQIGNFPNPTSGLLSTYTGAAAAYSVRQLANTAVLCMRVRRDNDDAEQNIGFDANGDLDTSAIATFVGSGNNGYVSKWYDQSGNGRDAAQSTNGSQPKIYNGSAVITDNGKPALDFDGLLGGDNLTASGFGTGTTRYVTHVCNVIGGGAGYENVWMFLENASTPTTGDFMQYYSATPSSGSIFNSPVNARDISGSSAVNQQRLATFVALPASTQFFIDGTSEGSGSGSITSLEDELGLGKFGSNLALMKFQELIVWNADQSSNRSGIETDINDYFSIY